MGLFDNCNHTKTKAVGYHYPAKNGWNVVTMRKCVKCGDKVEGTEKVKFSKNKPK